MTENNLNADKNGVKFGRYLRNKCYLLALHRITIYNILLCRAFYIFQVSGTLTLEILTHGMHLSH